MKRFILILLLLTPPAFAQSYLESALPYIPDSFVRASFSNWDLLRSERGVTRAELSTQDAYDSFARTILNTAIDVNRYGRWRNFRNGHDWGWDHRDLEWQVTASGPANETLFIMKFHESFSFSELKSLLKKQGYELTTYKNTEIYSHSLVKPVIFMDPAFHSAVLEEQGLILASDSLEPLELAIDTALGQAASFNDGAMQSLTQSWTGVDVAALLKGEYYCKASRFPEKELEALNEVYTLDAYEALGLRVESGDAEGLRFTMTFATAELAQANLTARQELADIDKERSGGLFEFEAAELDSNHLTLSLAPSADLLDLFGIIDNLYFTVCP